jgi:hypothetical protein
MLDIGGRYIRRKRRKQVVRRLWEREADADEVLVNNVSGSARS